MPSALDGRLDVCLQDIGSLSPTGGRFETQVYYFIIHRKGREIMCILNTKESMMDTFVLLKVV